MEDVPETPEIKENFRDTIFSVSDVHLASKFFHDKVQKEKFWQFLEEVGNNPRSRELILNGDIIETWSSPIEEVYSVEKIFAHDDVIKFATIINILLNKGIRVVYIIGNHDCRVHEAAIKDLLGPKVEVRHTYVNYGIHFSHGHKYDYFNSNDPVGEDGLPVGYYATRVDHKYDIGLTHTRRNSLRDTMDKILPDLTNSRLLIAERTIISAFMTHMFVKARPIYTLWKTGGVPRITNEKGEGETMSKHIFHKNYMRIGMFRSIGLSY
eukprot:Phypoly_transcript_08964.p1 GENE.Phypoly_transcript_08964~~Phypoly_transcript_08964.p1  ORF type:complete len:267 (+),score=29.63 Phypoly_transcript_08964:136-936(+)